MSAPVNDGGPAFARTLGETERNEHAMSGQGPAPFAQSGMSLRDYFAAQAMQGFIAGHFAHEGHDDYWHRADIASEAYEMADAMLKARAA